jgi:hypothetical protein
MTTETPGFANQASSYGAEQTRRALFFWGARDNAGDVGSITGGLRAAGDLKVTAPVSGMTVNVATGECIIPGSSSVTQGGYYGLVSSTTSLVVAASNATNPRVDLVAGQVTDAGYTGGTNTFVWRL